MNITKTSFYCRQMINNEQIHTHTYRHTYEQRPSLTLHFTFNVSFVCYSCCCCYFKLDIITITTTKTYKQSNENNRTIPK